MHAIKAYGRVKVVPLQDWSGPEGSRKLRFPDDNRVLRRVFGPKRDEV
jgi:hypothetical protein